MEYIYEPFDYFAVYDPNIGTPVFDWPEPESPYQQTVEWRVGNTWYVVTTSCGGDEPLAYKVKRLIFSDREEKADDKCKKLC